jgi:hypothetical protein
MARVLDLLCVLANIPRIPIRSTNRLAAKPSHSLFFLLKGMVRGKLVEVDPSVSETC